MIILDTYVLSAILKHGPYLSNSEGRLAQNAVLRFSSNHGD